MATYWADQNGRVFSDYRGKHEIKPWHGTDGYLYVTIVSNGTRVNIALHRLVFETNSGKIPLGMQINHKNGDKSDNRLENLECVTPKANTAHARANGLMPKQCGHKNPQHKLTEGDIQSIRLLREIGWSIKCLSEANGVCGATISKICLRQTWKHVA